MQRIPLGGIEEVAKEHEMIARDHEIELKHFELYQVYERDIRTRTDTIAKGIFLIGGGSLTLSIGIFTRPDRPILGGAELMWLKVAWASLFASVACLLLVQLILLIRSDRYASAWARKIKKEKPQYPDQTVSGIAAWAFGLLGFGACLLGLFLLAYVSVSVLK